MAANVSVVIHQIRWRTYVLVGENSKMKRSQSENGYISRAAGLASGPPDFVA